VARKLCDNSGQAQFRAGRDSAREPQATFQPQRQGMGAAEVTGHTHASDGRPLKLPPPVPRESPVRPRFEQEEPRPEAPGP
jgi:hypothetical protein